jgi:hypothetical protein
VLEKIAGDIGAQATRACFPADADQTSDFYRCRTVVGQQQDQIHRTSDKTVTAIKNL